MRSEFCIKFKVDLPSVTDKRQMLERVQLFSRHFAENLEDWVTHVELLNHTLTFYE